jgi:hypothetical protein
LRQEIERWSNSSSGEWGAETTVVNVSVKGSVSARPLWSVLEQAFASSLYNRSFILTDRWIVDEQLGMPIRGFLFRPLRNNH